MFHVRKQEKYRFNAATALYFPPHAHKLSSTAQHGTIDDIIALIKANLALTPATQHNRRPIIYELVKQDRENIIQHLYVQLGEHVIRTEFKRDILQALSILKMPIENNENNNTLKENIDEIMSILYSSSAITPALMSEGQYLSLSKKLAIAYNAHSPLVNELLTHAEAIFHVNLQQNTFDGGRIHTLIRYLIDGKPRKN